MNVCSVLINTLDYLNPPSELRPVTHTEGYERSKIKAPPTPSSLLKHSLLIKLLSLPFPRVPALVHPPACLSFVTVSLLLPCSSWKRRWFSPTVWLNGPGPFSITTALCCGKQGTSVQMKLEVDGNYRLGFLKSTLLFFSRSIWKAMGCKGWGAKWEEGFQSLLFSIKHTPPEEVLVETVLKKFYLG